MPAGDVDHRRRERGPALVAKQRKLQIVGKVFVLLLMPVVVVILVKLMSYDIDATTDEGQALAAHQQRTPAARALTLLWDFENLSAK